MNRRLRTGLAALLLATVVAAGAQEVPQDLFPAEVEAAEAFRLGVVAFHNGFFNQAILAFQRALAFAQQTDPDGRDTAVSLVTRWLGWAYYRSGFVDAAVSNWELLRDFGQAGAYMSSVLEVVTARRGDVQVPGVAPEFSGRYVELGSIPGVLQTGAVRFRRPTSVRPQADGSFYVVGFAEDTIHRMDVNGLIRGSLRGGIEGFSQPYDIHVTAEGRIFVSEFGSDRITEVDENDFVLNRFGGPGRGAGSLLGPQFLAEDGEGFLYVTEWGNRRVSKFDPEGEFILSFGRSAGRFPGLSGPSGIVIVGDLVYVADSLRASIEVFDTSGNHLRTLGSGQFRRPEGLSVLNETTLFVADEQNLRLFDLNLEAVARAFESTGGGRLMLGDLDANGMLVAADFDRGRVLQLGSVESVYTGFFVTVDKIVAAAFPTLDVHVTVQDRWGKPVVGLQEVNFYLTEEGVAYRDAELIYREHLDETANVAFLADRRVTDGDLLEELAEAAGALAGQVLNRGSVRVVLTGDRPVLEVEDGGPLQIADAVLSAGRISRLGLDLGIRFSADELISRPGRRAIVLLTDGGTSPESFGTYGLRELADYLRINDVALVPVIAGVDPVAEELRYLAEQSGGRIYRLLDPLGVSDLVADLRARPSGRYVLRYRSTVNPDFGRAYIELDVETFLANRSGRGDSGYYPPLEF